MENEYKNMGYQNLRIYAKKVGVKSPSSLTKAELIKEIKKIESGQTKPHYTNRGRPRINKFTEIDSGNNLHKIEIENKELKQKIKELNNKNQKIEQEFKDFKTLIKEIIFEL